MRFFRTLDDAVIDHVYQPVANRLQGFGSPKQISLFCLTGFLVLIGVKVVLTYIEQGTLIVFDSVVFLLGPAIYWLNARRDFTSQARNPLRLIPWYALLRLSMLLTFACDSGAAVIEGATLHNVIRWAIGLCITSQFYFEVCDRPPPPLAKPSWQESPVYVAR